MSLTSDLSLVFVSNKNDISGCLKPDGDYHLDNTILIIKPDAKLDVSGSTFKASADSSNKGSGIIIMGLNGNRTNHSVFPLKIDRRYLNQATQVAFSQGKASGTHVIANKLESVNGPFVPAETNEKRLMLGSSPAPFGPIYFNNCSFVGLGCPELEISALTVVGWQTAITSNMRIINSRYKGLQLDQGGGVSIPGGDIHKGGSPVFNPLGGITIQDAANDYLDCGNVHNISGKYIFYDSSLSLSASKNKLMINKGNNSDVNLSKAEFVMKFDNTKQHYKIFNTSTNKTVTCEKIQDDNKVTPNCNIKFNCRVNKTQITNDGTIKDVYIEDPSGASNSVFNNVTLKPKYNIDNVTVKGAIHAHTNEVANLLLNKVSFEPTTSNALQTDASFNDFILLANKVLIDGTTGDICPTFSLSAMPNVPGIYISGKMNVADVLFKNSKANTYAPALVVPRGKTLTVTENMTLQAPLIVTDGARLFADNVTFKTASSGSVNNNHKPCIIILGDSVGTSEELWKVSGNRTVCKSNLKCGNDKLPNVIKTTMRRCKLNNLGDKTTNTPALTLAYLKDNNVFEYNTIEDVAGAHCHIGVAIYGGNVNMSTTTCKNAGFYTDEGHSGTITNLELDTSGVVSGLKSYVTCSSAPDDYKNINSTITGIKQLLANSDTSININNNNIVRLNADISGIVKTISNNDISFNEATKEQTMVDISYSDALIKYNTESLLIKTWVSVTLPTYTSIQAQLNNVHMQNIKYNFDASYRQIENEVNQLKNSDPTASLADTKKKMADSSIMKEFIDMMGKEGVIWPSGYPNFFKASTVQEPPAFINTVSAERLIRMFEIYWTFIIQQDGWNDNTLQNKLNTSVTKINKFKSDKDTFLARTNALVSILKSHENAKESATRALGIKEGEKDVYVTRNNIIKQIGGTKDTLLKKIKTTIEKVKASDLTSTKFSIDNYQLNYTDSIKMSSMMTGDAGVFIKGQLSNAMFTDNMIVNIFTQFSGRNRFNIPNTQLVEDITLPIAVNTPALCIKGGDTVEVKGDVSLPSSLIVGSDAIFTADDKIFNKQSSNAGVNTAFPPSVFVMGDYGTDMKAYGPTIRAQPALGGPSYYKQSSNVPILDVSLSYSVNPNWVKHLETSFATVSLSPLSDLIKTYKWGVDPSGASKSFQINLERNSSVMQSNSDAPVAGGVEYWNGNRSSTSTGKMTNGNWVDGSEYNLIIRQHASVELPVYVWGQAAPAIDPSNNWHNTNWWTVARNKGEKEAEEIANNDLNKLNEKYKALETGRDLVPIIDASGAIDMSATIINRQKWYNDVSGALKVITIQAIQAGGSAVVHSSPEIKSTDIEFKATPLVWNNTALSTLVLASMFTEKMGSVTSVLNVAKETKLEKPWLKLQYPVNRYNWSVGKNSPPPITKSSYDWVIQSRKWQHTIFKGTIQDTTVDGKPVKRLVIEENGKYNQWPGNLKVNAQEIFNGEMKTEVKAFILDEETSELKPEILDTTTTNKSNTFTMGGIKLRYGLEDASNLVINKCTFDGLGSYNISALSLVGLKGSNKFDNMKPDAPRPASKVHTKKSVKNITIKSPNNATALTLWDGSVDVYDTTIINCSQTHLVLRNNHAGIMVGKLLFDMSAVVIQPLITSDYTCHTYFQKDKSTAVGQSHGAVEMKGTYRSTSLKMFDFDNKIYTPSIYVGGGGDMTFATDFYLPTALRTDYVSESKALFMNGITVTAQSLADSGGVREYSLPSIYVSSANTKIKNVQLDGLHSYDYSKAALCVKLSTDMSLSDITIRNSHGKSLDIGQGTGSTQNLIIGKITIEEQKEKLIHASIATTNVGLDNLYIKMNTANISEMSGNLIEGKINTTKMPVKNLYLSGIIDKSLTVFGTQYTESTIETPLIFVDGTLNISASNPINFEFGGIFVVDNKSTFTANKVRFNGSKNSTKSTILCLGGASGAGGHIFKELSVSDTRYQFDYDNSARTKAINIQSCTFENVGRHVDNVPGLQLVELTKGDLTFEGITMDKCDIKIYGGNVDMTGVTIKDAVSSFMQTDWGHTGKIENLDFTISKAPLSSLIETGLRGEFGQIASSSVSKGQHTTKTEFKNVHMDGLYKVSVEDSVKVRKPLFKFNTAEKTQVTALRTSGHYPTKVSDATMFDLANNITDAKLQVELEKNRLKALKSRRDTLVGEIITVSGEVVKKDNGLKSFYDASSGELLTFITTPISSESGYKPTSNIKLGKKVADASLIYFDISLVKNPGAKAFKFAPANKDYQITLLRNSYAKSGVNGSGIPVPGSIEAFNGDRRANSGGVDMSYNWIDPDLYVFAYDPNGGLNVTSYVESNGQEEKAQWVITARFNIGNGAYVYRTVLAGKMDGNKFVVNKSKYSNLPKYNSTMNIIPRDQTVGTATFHWLKGPSGTKMITEQKIIKELNTELVEYTFVGEPAEGSIGTAGLLTASKYAAARTTAETVLSDAKNALRILTLEKDSAIIQINDMERHNPDGVGSAHGTLYQKVDKLNELTSKQLFYKWRNENQYKWFKYDPVAAKKVGFPGRNDLANKEMVADIYTNNMHEDGNNKQIIFNSNPQNTSNDVSFGWYAQWNKIIADTSGTVNKTWSWSIFDEGKLDPSLGYAYSAGEKFEDTIYNILGDITQIDKYVDVSNVDLTDFTVTQDISDNTNKITFLNRPGSIITPPCLLIKKDKKLEVMDCEMKLCSPLVSLPGGSLMASNVVFNKDTRTDTGGRGASIVLFGKETESIKTMCNKHLDDVVLTTRGAGENKNSLNNVILYQLGDENLGALILGGLDNSDRLDKITSYESRNKGIDMIDNETVGITDVLVYNSQQEGIYSTGNAIVSNVTISMKKVVIDTVGNSWIATASGNLTVNNAALYRVMTNSSSGKETPVLVGYDNVGSGTTDSVWSNALMVSAGAALNINGTQVPQSMGVNELVKYNKLGGISFVSGGGAYLDLNNPCISLDVRNKLTGADTVS